MADDGKREVRIERVKLRASWLNSISVAIFAVGGLAPLMTIVYRGDGFPASVVVVSGFCFLVSIVLHLIATAILGALKR